MQQPSLFETAPKTVERAHVVFYALGEFQARKKELIGRELPLDRLRGAFRRAAEHFETDELSDQALVDVLGRLGAKITQLPAFRAKHPFRVTVGEELAARAAEFYQKKIEQAGKL